MKSTQLLQSKAYDYLKDLILNDKLEHGVIYSQKKVAGRTGNFKNTFERCCFTAGAGTIY